MRFEEPRRLGAALVLPARAVLPAALAGSVVMLLDGAPLARWGGQLAALVGTALATLLFVRGPWRRRAALGPASMGLLLVLLAVSLAFAAPLDARRWVWIGSLRVHASALAAPLLLLGIAARWTDGRARAALAWAAGVTAVHLAQPDAGQATAFAAGLAVLASAHPEGGRLARRDRRPTRHRTMMAILAAVGLATWLRHTPLAPAPFVEEILPRAFALGLPVGIGAAVALALVPLVPARAALRAHRTWRQGGWAVPAGALAAYLGAGVLVALAGAFPTPVLGYGPSALLGTTLALGLLASAR